MFSNFRHPTVAPSQYTYSSTFYIPQWHPLSTYILQFPTSHSGTLSVHIFSNFLHSTVAPSQVHIFSYFLHPTVVPSQVHIFSNFLHPRVAPSQYTYSPIFHIPQCTLSVTHTKSVNKVMRLIQYNSVLTFKLQIEFVPFKIVPLGGYTPLETLFPLFVATLVVANRNRF